MTQIPQFQEPTGVPPVPLSEASFHKPFRESLAEFEERQLDAREAYVDAQAAFVNEGGAPERDEEVQAALTGEEPSVSLPDAPEPLWAGTYAIYDDGSEGLMLVIGTREGEVHHKHLPAAMLKMAEKMGGSMLGGFFGG